MEPAGRETVFLYENLHTLQLSPAPRILHLGRRQATAMAPPGNTSAESQEPDWERLREISAVSQLPIRRIRFKNLKGDNQNFKAGGDDRFRPASPGP